MIYLKYKNDDERYNDFIKLINNKISKDVINGNLYIGNINIKSLNNVKIINGYLDLNNNTSLTSLDNIEYIKKYANLEYSVLYDLGKLKRVDNFFSLEGNINIKSLYPLEYIGDDCFLQYTNIEDISSVKYIKGLLYISEDTKIPYKQYSKFNFKII